jgi:type I restriction enzyme S subunit
MAATKNTKAFYKTEIPSDWEVKKLGECCLVKGEYGINASAVEFSDELPAYLRITDIDNDGNYSSIKKTSVGDPNYEQFILKDGDIVFARTGATVGKTYLYKSKDGILVFAGFLIRFRTNEKILMVNHLKYFTESKLYWDWVKTVSMRSGQPGINAEEYSSLKIPLPPLPEQKAIAQVLSTADAAIHTTEKLISQKILRKKWLMQQLLTGKKRLMGFEGEWKEVRLKDVTTNFSRRNKDLVDAKVYSVTNKSGFVLQSDHFEGKVAGEDLSNYKIIKKNEFAYNPARVNVGSLAYFEEEIGVISSLYVCFKTTKDVLDYFLLQFLQIDHTKHRIEALGEGGVRVYLWYDLFSKIKIKIPTIEEQTGIAQVLQAADKEISLLKAKAGKLREQKKGLMQVLLTGKVRLKISNK